MRTPTWASSEMAPYLQSGKWNRQSRAGSAQDEQDALYSADFSADPNLSYNYMTEAQQAEQDAMYFSAAASTDPNISYVHETQVNRRQRKSMPPFRNTTD